MIVVLTEENDVICNGSPEKMVILQHCTDSPAYLKIIRVRLRYAKRSDRSFIRYMDPQDKVYQC